MTLWSLVAPCTLTWLFYKSHVKGLNLKKVLPEFISQILIKKVKIEKNPPSHYPPPIQSSPTSLSLSLADIKRSCTHHSRPSRHNNYFPWRLPKILLRMDAWCLEHPSPLPLGRLLLLSPRWIELEHEDMVIWCIFISHSTTTHLFFSNPPHVMCTRYALSGPWES
jgi:hypothetical protein